MGGDRLVVPRILRRELIRQLHETRQRVESALRDTREILYWPNMKVKYNEHKTSIVATSAALVAPNKSQKLSFVTTFQTALGLKLPQIILKRDNKQYLVTVSTVSLEFLRNQCVIVFLRTIYSPVYK